MKATIFLLLLAPFALRADTTIAPAEAHAYGANLGWVDARGDVTHGAVVGEFICAGWLYAANVGWLHLGDGTPTNGIRYGNTTANDCGVNTQDYAIGAGLVEAKLRGFAYGANIGWVAFTEVGDPRVDLGTGALRGSAWSANAGWIVLGSSSVTVRTITLDPGADTDTDGIADAWEFLHAEKLSAMDATTDFDRDGVLDRDEYAADTDPTDARDTLRILAFVAPRPLISGGTNFVSDFTWTSRPTRRYAIEITSALPTTTWTTWVEKIAPTGSTTTRQFPDTPGTQRYYRVRAERPL